MKKNNAKPQKPAAPTNRQMQWQQTEFYGLVSYGMNTFTDSEWGSGGESPELFAPEKLRVKQWVRVAKGAGMKGLVLTVKHYDGFCLWHTAETKHSVEYSPYQKDLMAELAEQCAAEGLKLGISIALWDRHDLRYGKGEVYEQYFTAQLRELLTNYGELFYVHLDSTCGEGKKGRTQTMDMDKIIRLIRSLQPNAVIAGFGPDVRFSGNYVGFCRKAEWSEVPYYYAPTEPKKSDLRPPRKYSLTDLELGTAKKLKKGYRTIWYPAEVSLPMRKGWFYHENERYDTKPLSKLVDAWYNAVGGNACLMLGISPDKTGKICEADMETLLSLGAQISIDFKEDLAQESAMTCSGCSDGQTQAANVLKADDSFWHSGTAEPSYLEIDLLDEYDINKIVLREAITKGQHVEAFTVLAQVGEKWQKQFVGTTIGACRICKFPEEIRIRRIRVVFDKTRDFVAIARLEAY